MRHSGFALITWNKNLKNNLMLNKGLLKMPNSSKSESFKWKYVIQSFQLDATQDLP